MFDPITLDQLRALVTVVEEGSFSAAARKLRRVQSAVSTAMSNLENQLGVPLWDRSTKVARLTEQGHAVLAAARRVLLEVDSLKRLTSDMVMGLEAQVSLCVDALFPLSALVSLCEGFAKEFPSVDLRVDIQVLSAVTERVVSGAATIGVVAPPAVAGDLERTFLGRIEMIPVTGPKHPLASLRGPIPAARLADAVQVVLSERRDAGIADQAVLSPRTWRVADLHTKHALLRANLGWGNMPEHLVRNDLRSRKLVRIRPQAWVGIDLRVTFHAVYRPGSMFGPAHRWVLDRLASLIQEHRRNR
ncbi:LysR family transcriptional regulator [Pendulispora rubella]|uniref:LysR family transcriptional regulator n=1 Tax=Pendulispora rubella TaxID=2741070 RepID=A0ABZ2L472_9BACT